MSKTLSKLSDILAARKQEADASSSYAAKLHHDDPDKILKKIGGIARHTGRGSCFYQALENNNWISVDPVLKDPHEIYNK